MRSYLIVSATSLVVLCTGFSLPAAERVAPRDQNVWAEPAGDSLAVAMANFVARTGLDVAPNDQGQVEVRHVRSGSDAARAGIRPGTVLASVNGVPVSTMTAFEQYLAQHRTAAAFDVGIVSVASETSAARNAGNPSVGVPMGRQLSILGMTIFPDSSDRPVVHRVASGSAAAAAGIRAGDVITGLDHQTTGNMTQFMNFTVPFIRDLSPGEQVPFYVNRDGKPLAVKMIRPDDAALEPLTPAEERILARQAGVLSTATQVPLRRTPTEPRPTPRPGPRPWDTTFYWWYNGDPFYYTSPNGSFFFGYDPYMGYYYPFGYNPTLPRPRYGPSY